MAPDGQRIEHIRKRLADAGLDGLFCTLPSNVLMVSGHWPVVGTSAALVDREGRVIVLVPEDEEELARRGWAQDVRTFKASSMDDLRSASEGIGQPLAEAARSLGLRGGVGYEAAAVTEPASYVGMHLYLSEAPNLLRETVPGCTPTPADAILRRLRSLPTEREAERIRVACGIARRAFEQGVKQIRVTMTEVETAQTIEPSLSTFGIGHAGAARAGGRVFCMSGPNAAEAYAAFQRSRDRRLTFGDLVLIHCNSFADGFFTDITRTYCLGPPATQQKAMYEAMLAARSAALAAIRPGVRGCDVDQAARKTLEERGFGREYKNPTGHGVGFVAIDHNAPPRLHPKSEDVLEEGMVFNVEPAIYIKGQCGMRHCDMVRVTAEGAEVLTDFHTDKEELMVA